MNSRRCTGEPVVGPRAPMADPMRTGGGPRSRTTYRPVGLLRLAAGRAATAVGLVMVGVVLLAGCGRPAPQVAVPQTFTEVTTPTSAAPATPAPSVAPVPPAPAVPVTSATPAKVNAEIVHVDADAFVLAPVEGVWFATPSRNINCLMWERSVTCDVLDNTWSLPPRPADCELDFGISVGFAEESRGGLGCAGDTVHDDDSAVLEYGTAVEYNGMTCTSRRSGVRCSNSATGNGFAVSRADYTLF